MVFLFLLLIMILFMTSKIVIDIRKFEIESINSVSNTKIYSDYKNNKFYNDYDIKIKLQILQFLPILCFKIDKRKLEKLCNSKKFKNIRLKNIKYDNVKKYINLKNIKEIKEKILINMKYFILKINIGTGSIILTSFVVSIVSFILSILLTNKTVKTPNPYFKIQPIYSNRKLYKF